MTPEQELSPLNDATVEFMEWFKEYSKYWGSNTVMEVRVMINVVKAAYLAGFAAGVDASAEVAREAIKSLDCVSGNEQDVISSILRLKEKV